MDLQRVPRVELLARPFVKWAGGKSSIADRVVGLLDAVPYGRYFEPFLGGGAVFFALRPRRAVVSDANLELINAYRQLRKDVEAVISSLEAFKARHSKEAYYRARSNPPAGPIDRAAWFIYLNKTCFNGLWRVNSRGVFNVPMGSYKNPKIVDPKGLRDCAAALRGATVLAGEFEAVLMTARARPVEGDVVYLDPPYDPLSPTSSFTSYTPSGFGVVDQERLSEVCADLTRRRVRFVLSNSATPRVKQLYSDRGYRSETVRMGRSINSVGRRRGKIDELLIRNF